MTDSEGSLLTVAQPVTQEMAAPPVMLFYSLKKRRERDGN